MRDCWSGNTDRPGGLCAKTHEAPLNPWIGTVIGKFANLFAAGALISLLAYASAFTVHERRQAVVTRFGEIIRIETESGLYFKLPFPYAGADRLVMLEDRLLSLKLAGLRVQVSSGKFYRIDAFLAFRIGDPRKLMEAAGGDTELAVTRMQTRLDAVLRQIYGQKPFEEALSVKRNEMMRDARKSLETGATELGFTIEEVRIIRTDLANAVVPQAYDRMKAERLAIAEGIRASGTEAARRVRAKAERDAVEILAAASRDAEILKGEGEARSTQIFAARHEIDPEFYQFYRSMDAYRLAMTGDNTNFVLPLANDFLKYLSDSGEMGKDEAVKLAPLERP